MTLPRLSTDPRRPGPRRRPHHTRRHCLNKGGPPMTVLIDHGLKAYRAGLCKCSTCRAGNTARVQRSRRGVPDVPTAQRVSLADVPWPGLWSENGACRTRDPGEFFPIRGVDTRPAKALCETCPVLLECRGYGLTYPSLKGLWGGLSERQRRRIRRATKLDLLEREAG